MTWVGVGVTVGSALIGGAQAKKQQKKDSKAAGEADAYTRAQQARQEQLQQQVDAAYSTPARQQQYNTFANSLRDFYGTQLNRKKLDASRALKFGLAKQGLTGSSVAADRGKRLGDEFSDAALSNEREVQSAVANLRSSDQAAKAQLKSEIGNGLQLNQVGARSNEAQKEALDTADVAARARGVGDVFSDTLSTYKAIQERNLLRGGYNAARQNLWGPPPGS